MSEEAIKYIIGKIKKSSYNSRTRKTCYLYVKEIKDRLDRINNRI